MKEIDFLPAWYTRQRRRKNNYRKQYVIFACVLLLMLGWSAATVRSIASANSRIERLERAAVSPENYGEYAQMKEKFAALISQETLLARIDPHVRTADVIGEISYLADEQIKLGKLSFQAEKFPTRNPSPATSPGMVRAVREALKERTGPYEGDIRFKVTLSGIAADSTRVAQLVNKLEESPYFFRVVPVYSRNGRVHDRVVSEFEITCYVANYAERATTSADTAGTGGTEGAM